MYNAMPENIRRQMEVEAPPVEMGYSAEEGTFKYRLNKLYARRNEHRAYLARTDWCEVKCSEQGIDIRSKYPEQSALREQAREIINLIEAEIAAHHV